MDVNINIAADFTVAVRGFVAKPSIVVEAKSLLLVIVVLASRVVVHLFLSGVIYHYWYITEYFLATYSRHNLSRPVNAPCSMTEI